MRFLSVGFIFLVHFLFGGGSLRAQEKNYLIATAAFYNVENLFDTVNSVDLIDRKEAYASPRHRVCMPHVDAAVFSEDSFFVWDTQDSDYTPNGKLRWDSKKYRQKIKHLAHVISEIGREKSRQAPVIVGLAEVENRAVLEDLVADETLAPFDYGIIHFESPDERGIDAALLYKKQRFVPLESKPIELALRYKGGFLRTRDLLMVKGRLDGELFYFLVNHWPSRSRGEKASAPLRMQAAALCKGIVDSIQARDGAAKIIVMGDFNDDPIDKSIAQKLGASAEKNYGGGHLFNAMSAAYKRGEGTLAYRDNWNLFDQLILSSNLLPRSKIYDTYKFWRAGIFKPFYVIQSSGNFKGYPFRTYQGGIYTGGYSDHFPIYLYLIKERLSSPN